MKPRLYPWFFSALVLAGHLAPCYTSPPTPTAPTPPDKPVVLSVQEIEPVLLQFKKELSEVRTLRARFQQTKHMPILKTTLKSSGEVFFAKPDRIRFAYTKPYQSVIVVDGRKAVRYEKIANRWKRIVIRHRALQQAILEMLRWMSGDFDIKPAHYKLTARRSGKLITLVLTPKPKKKIPFKALELTFSEDRSYISTVLIRESERVFTKLEFARPETNPKLSQSVFSTSGKAPGKVPPGKAKKPTLPKPITPKPASRP